MGRILEFLRLKASSPVKRALIFKKKGVKMGLNCQIFPDCSFGSEPFLIELGNDVKITNGCQFITHDGGVEVLRNLFPELSDIDVFGKIKIGNNVFIGNKCIILPNVTIGNNVVIGAGSVITKNIPSDNVIAGVPAKIIKDLHEYKNSVEKNVCIPKEWARMKKRYY